MKLSEIKNALQTVTGVNFQLPDGSFVPEHFHVTEVGLITKHFIDCGGTVRSEKKAAFQLWDAADSEHRLKPQKLAGIISLSEKILGLEDLDVEVEYQHGTISKYALDFNGTDFLLVSTQTACLANEACGVPSQKSKVSIQELSIANQNTCTPGGGCC